MSAGRRAEMELLRKVGEGEYPTDYLLSRIRARRALMITDWRRLLLGEPLRDLVLSRYGPVPEEDPEAVWRFLLKEFGSVYFQMNKDLRSFFAPFFLYAELRTVFICLRYAKGGEDGKIGGLLSLSLLSGNIREILGGGRDLPLIIDGLGEMLSPLSKEFAGLGIIFEKKGLRGIEQRVTTAYLEYVVHSGLDPLMKEFFVSIIDSRNVLSLYKHIRARGKAAPQFIDGGRITEKIYAGIAAKKDGSALEHLLLRITGFRIEDQGIATVESSLYKMTTRLLRRAGREPLCFGVILDYLWRCSLEARNLSVLLYGSHLEREVLAAEIVQ